MQKDGFSWQEYRFLILTTAIKDNAGFTLKEQHDIPHMSTEDENKKFIQIADTFIDLANQHCDDSANALVNASFLYGSARFCAFLTASAAGNREKYEANIDDAVNYYTEEFARMLREHMEQYKSVFEQQELRYQHLMKEKPQG